MNKTMMKEQYERLPYRDNVGCIVKKDDLFLLVQLTGWPENFWKFPQGGIERGETINQAALRELKEELGNGHFNLVGLSNYTHQYDWNDDSIRLAGFRWRGQKQQFVLVEYAGALDEITLNPSETQSYKWVKRVDLASHIEHDHPLFLNYRDAIENVLNGFGL